jgi:AcrR family transcriptional regulator
MSKPAPAPHIEAPTWVLAQRDVSPRHREVLEAALDLVAERGYAGASLRELARRVGMAQPSLYHYFASKESLVEQLIEHFAADMLVELPMPPEKLDDVPRVLVEYVARVWTKPSHAKFVRVASAVSRAEPRFAGLLREIFTDRFRDVQLAVVQYYAAREGFDTKELSNFVRMLSYAVAFHLFEERSMFDERELGEDTREFVEFCVRFGRDWIAFRRQRLEAG